MLIALSSFASAENDLTLTFLCHVDNDKSAFGFTDDRSDGNSNDKIFPFFSEAFISCAILPILGDKTPLEFEVGKRVDVRYREHDDVSPASSVSSVRAAGRNEFFSSERDTAVAAFAGSKVNGCFIYKHTLPLYAILKAEALKNTKKNTGSKCTI